MKYSQRIILLKSVQYLYILALIVLFIVNLFFFIKYGFEFLKNSDSLYYLEMAAVILTLLIYATSYSNFFKAIASLFVPCAIYSKILYTIYNSGINIFFYTLKTYPFMIFQLLFVVIFSFFGIALSVWYSFKCIPQVNGHR